MPPPRAQINPQGLAWGTSRCQVLAIRERCPDAVQHETVGIPDYRRPYFAPLRR